MVEHYIIGTAGHIDHGKTCLVKALTGRDTDRLKEEKRRGITIDPGFTYYDLSDGTRAGLIDVPGHEKLISNMAAVSAGMDLVLLVVAADEGVMPQTREHLDILNYFGVSDYILVLNKCDLAEPEWLDLAEEETREELAGALSEDTPVVRVSAKTGEGIEALRQEMENRLFRQRKPERKKGAFPRLPIDQVFHIPGFGAVVTGTLLGGELKKSDPVVLMPSGEPCRIRGIQVHREEAQAGIPGQRCAVNLAGTPDREISRGEVLTLPGKGRKGRRINVRISLLPRSRRKLSGQMRLHFYCGTAQAVCRVTLLNREELLAGEECYAQLRLEKDLALWEGDRFFVRFYSPVETIGGGVVIETAAKKAKRWSEKETKRLSQIERGTDEEKLRLFLEEHRDVPCSFQQILDQMERWGMTPDETAKAGRIGVECGEYLAIPRESPGFLWHREGERKLREKLTERLGQWCACYPCRAGIPDSQLVKEWLPGREKGQAELILSWLEKDRFLERRGNLLCLWGYRPAQAKEYQMAQKRAIEKYREEGTEFLERDILLETMDSIREEKNREEFFELLVREGEMKEVSPGIYTTREILEGILHTMEALLEGKEKITILEVKEQFQTSRKYAKYILACTDMAGITEEAGAPSERLCRKKNKQGAKEE